ncbi:MAG: ATP synthase subunit I [Pseudomonadota bacterium]
MTADLAAAAGFFAAGLVFGSVFFFLVWRSAAGLIRSRAHPAWFLAGFVGRLGLALGALAVLLTLSPGPSGFAAALIGFTLARAMALRWGLPAADREVR